MTNYNRQNEVLTPSKVSSIASSLHVFTQCEKECPVLTAEEMLKKLILKSQMKIQTKRNYLLLISFGETGCTPVHFFIAWSYRELFTGKKVLGQNEAGKILFG